MNGARLHGAPPLVLSLSPRAQGNSDAAAGFFAAGAAEALGVPVPVVRLCEGEVAPCLSCKSCDGGGVCPQESGDEVGAIFAAMASAPFVFLSAPIYFYHLPAQAKALVDRSQSWYMRGLAGDPAVVGLPRRDAYCCLVAGRRKGQQLFEGSLLTLKYFLRVFNLELREPLTLRGIDAPGDLVAAEDARQALLAIGRGAALRARVGLG